MRLQGLPIWLGAKPVWGLHQPQVVFSWRHCWRRCWGSGGSCRWVRPGLVACTLFVWGSITVLAGVLDCLAIIQSLCHQSRAVAAAAAVFLIRRRRRQRTQAPPPADGGEKGALDTFLPPPSGMLHGANWDSRSGGNDNGNVQSFPTAPHSSPPQSYRSLLLQPTGSGSGGVVPGIGDTSLAASAGSSAAPETAAGSAYDARTASELATLPTVQEDLADGPLATFPTRPAGLPPASLGTLQAGIVTAAMVAPVGGVDTAVLFSGVEQCTSLPTCLCAHGLRPHSHPAPTTPCRA